MAQRVGTPSTSTGSIKHLMWNLSLLIRRCCYVDRVGLVEKAQLPLE